MTNELLRASVRLADSEVAQAESELAALMQELLPTARAEKTAISKALEAAFERVRAAREHLGILEKLANEKDE